MNFGCMNFLIGIRLYVCLEFFFILVLLNLFMIYLNNYLIIEFCVIIYFFWYVVVFRCFIVIDCYVLLICEFVILLFDSKSIFKYLK